MTRPPVVDVAPMLARVAAVSHLFPLRYSYEGVTAYGEGQERMILRSDVAEEVNCKADLGTNDDQRVTRFVASASVDLPALAADLEATREERNDARRERDALADDLARGQGGSAKIARIKAVRIQFGLGLAEAKTMVESESAGAEDAHKSLTARTFAAEREAADLRARLTQMEADREAAARMVADARAVSERRIAELEATLAALRSGGAR